MDVKYVVTKSSGNEAVVVFSELITHSEMVRRDAAVSAGFASIYKDEKGELTASCWGHSVSLGMLKSRGDVDAELIKKQILLLGREYW